MLVEGKYGQAKVFANNPDPSVIGQVKGILDQDFIKGSKIRIMPDCHLGVGCVIGFTADLKDKVIPNIVGVDIGCGIITLDLGKTDLDLHKLDKIIHSSIPSGKKTHGHMVVDFDRLKDLNIYKDLKNLRRIENSIGTLGGGNHFIEVNEDDEGNKYLNIHSGSRNLGNQVANTYQRLAIENRKGRKEYLEERENLIKSLKEAGKEKSISKTLKNFDKAFKKKEPDYPKDLCFLEGEDRDDYLNDMAIAQEYASLNRKTMANIILSKLLGKSIDDFDYWETVHNYIDLESNIIRKGAISAEKGQRLLIPFNMRDGSLIALGKGNPDWNYSAPHGAGRIMSRQEAFKNLTLEDYMKDMEGIYSTSVNKNTLDEAPSAYKKMEDIMDVIGDTVEIKSLIKPIYNFKASN